MAMKRYALTASGPYKPGDIVSLSKVLFKNGCSIGDMKTGMLEGVFTATLVFSAPEDKSYLKKIKEFGKASGLKISLKEIPEKPFRHLVCANHIITVAGANKAGLVYKVAAALFKMGIGIIELETKRIEGEKRELYIMVFEVFSPAPEAKSRAGLKALGKRLGVRIGIRPIEAFGPIA